jgi:hypothetical protein
MANKKSTWLDGVLGSQLRDTQGEMLSIEGADISELEAGRGLWNDNHSKGAFNTLGRITYAKKIFKAEDCEDDRQRYYWDKIKAPYIYGKGYLFDDDDHPNARAAGAILRNIHRNDSPLSLKASVEGGVIARGISDPSLLARTKITKCALTFTPANNATLVEPLNLDKSSNWDTDLLLIKSVLHLAETNVPSFRHIARDASATKVQNNLLKLIELMKELGIEGDVTIPSKQKILEKAIEYKIQDNIQKIHNSISLLNNEENMNKGIKDALVAATAAAGITMAPQKTANINEFNTPKPNIQAPKEESTTDVVKEVANKYPLLGAIGQVETSGGQGKKHPTITPELLSNYYNIGSGKGKSMHSGMRAGGIFGMMPHSVAFTLRMDSMLAQKYPELMELTKDVKNNHHKISDLLDSNPRIASDCAISAFAHNKKNTKNEHMLVHSWLNGLKGSWNKYKDEGMDGIKNHPYVQKVMQEYEKLKPKKVQQKKQLEKALMAGYGGAGSPTANINGSVIQTESLDQGRGFKYIVCDNCGKDQIHAKHQVKCRSCGHSFSLEKLYRTLIGTK